MTLPPGTPGSRTMFHIELDLTAREIEALERYVQQPKTEPYLGSPLYSDDVATAFYVIKRIWELSKKQ